MLHLRGVYSSSFDNYLNSVRERLTDSEHEVSIVLVRLTDSDLVLYREKHVTYTVI
jgi:hypothetical protein